MVKKKRKNKQLNKPQGRADHGTPESINQAHGVKFETVDGGRAGAQKRAYISQQTPLDRYRARELVTDRQYRAGYHFFVLWDQTKAAQNITSSYDRVIVDGGGGGSGVNEFAYADYISLQRQLGREPSSVVRAVCIECESASAWAKRFRFPARMGIERLRAGLDLLATILRIG